MITALSIIHVIISVLLILSVLIHFGKGAEAGLVMDTNASSILPTKGNILNKITTTLAVLFLVLSLTLATMHGKMSSKSIFDSGKIPAATTTTAAHKGTDAANNTSTSNKPSTTTAGTTTEKK
ncbi:MAG: preprotein translocase subunit SecG [Oligoflexia bacterium]|nr:preprotein translocase subunit SecG [Oligoflexia bacterium]